MANPLEDSGEILKEAAEGITRNAGNANWVLGFCFIAMILIFLGGGGYFGNKLVDAQVEAVKISTEAIKSNSQAIADIRDMEKRQIETLEKIVRSEEGISDTCRQGLQDHTQMMNSLKQITPPAKNGG
jgi:hypothetical protein